LFHFLETNLPYLLDLVIPLNADDWFFILSNKHRRQIMRLCSIRPCYPQEISKLLNISPPLVIKHIQELEKRNIIVKREETRVEGGRNIQYYFVPFRPRFNFSLANDDLVEIDIIDESEKEVPHTPSRKKLIDIESIDENEQEKMKENFKKFIDLEHERIEIHQKLAELHNKQKFFFKSIKTESSQQQLLLKIIRFLLDRYGFTNEFSREDLIMGLGIDDESVNEIIQVLHHKLQIISLIISADSAQLEKFIVKSESPSDKDKFNYQ